MGNKCSCNYVVTCTVPLLLIINLLNPLIYMTPAQVMWLIVVYIILSFIVFIWSCCFPNANFDLLRWYMGPFKHSTVLVEHAEELVEPSWSHELRETWTSEAARSRSRPVRSTQRIESNFGTKMNRTLRSPSARGGCLGPRRASLAPLVGKRFSNHYSLVWAFSTRFSIQCALYLWLRDHWSLF